MTILKIGGKEYKIEFTFNAAEYKDCVQKAFKIVTGGYLAARQDEGIMGMIEGTGDMISDMPELCETFLYAGLLENDPVETELDAKVLLRQFFKENMGNDMCSYFAMFNFLKEQMEADGFFKLTGLDKIIEEMEQSATEGTEKTEKKKKEPQDRKMKQISTK